MTARAVLVCDAGPRFGSGHVMRQLTLGRELKLLGYEVELSCAELPIALEERAASLGVAVRKRNQSQNSPALIQALIEASADILVFDGYEFLPETIEKAHNSGTLTVVIDDNGEFSEVPCDVILNQNLHAEISMYASGPSGRSMLIGLEWALIREEVAQQDVPEWERRQGLILSVGGADHRGLGVSVANILEQADVGPFVRAGGFYGEVSMSPAEMASVMAHSMLGVLACGTTTWEALCLGLPTVGLVVADNQIHVAESLSKAGLSQYLDCREELDAGRLIELIRSALEDPIRLDRVSRDSRAMVDGLGGRRVAQALDSLIG